MGVALKQEDSWSFTGKPRFEALISELSAEFNALPAEDIDSAIDSSLGRLSNTLQIDQIRVLEFSRR